MDPTYETKYPNNSCIQIVSELNSKISQIPNVEKLKYTTSEHLICRGFNSIVFFSDNKHTAYIRINHQSEKIPIDARYVKIKGPIWIYEDKLVTDDAIFLECIKSLHHEEHSLIHIVHKSADDFAKNQNCKVINKFVTNSKSWILDTIKLTRLGSNNSIYYVIPKDPLKQRYFQIPSGQGKNAIIEIEAIFTR